MGNNDCDEGSAQKPAQPSEFHPQAEATPGYWGGGGAQGFPSPELVLTARCQGEIPTDALSVRAMGVQPTQSQRTVVSAANIDSINLGSHFSFAMAYQYHDVFLTIPAQDSQPKSQLRVTSIGSLPKNENCLYLGKSPNL